jgi:HSP90 family molecular chaperone
VLIDPAPKDLLPDWMRFMKGVIDSADIPLNISRETMQDSALVKKLGSVISKRVMKMFEKEAEADPEKFRGPSTRSSTGFSKRGRDGLRQPDGVGQACCASRRR